MSKSEELREMIRIEREKRFPDLPAHVLASESGWSELLGEIDPQADPVARRAGPMSFDGITVVIDPDLPAGEFKLQFGSELLGKKTAP